MGRFLKPFVSLYARHRVVELDETPDLITDAFDEEDSLEELAGVPGFAADHELVRDLKRQVERQLKELESGGVEIDRLQAGAQIRESLCIVFDLADEALEAFCEEDAHLRIDILRDLLQEMYDRNNWLEEQRNHFLFLVEKIKSWHNCFISYTNRNHQIVNDAYSKVIKLYVPAEERERLEKQGANALAEAVARCLRRELVTRCFYDKEDIKVGDLLKSELVPACARTFTFVQLVQQDLFDRNVAKNWCFEEYQNFKRAEHRLTTEHERFTVVLPKRLKPLLAGKQDEVRPAAKPKLEHRAWLRQLLDDRVFLPLPTDKKEFASSIKKLAGQIDELKRSLIQSVPA